MKDLSKVEEILLKAVSELHIPVACRIKVLLGPPEDVINFARKLESMGCSFLVICMYNDESSWDVMKEIKEKINVPVIFQGKLYSLENAQQCLQKTGVDAVLTSESLILNPALFSGTNLCVWDIAEEYLSLAEEYDTPLTCVKVYLNQMLKHSLEEYSQTDLARSDSFANFRTEFHMLKDSFLTMPEQHHGQTLATKFNDVKLEMQMSRMKIDSSLCQDKVQETEFSCIQESHLSKNKDTLNKCSCLNTFEDDSRERIDALPPPDGSDSKIINDGSQLLLPVCRSRLFRNKCLDPTLKHSIHSYEDVELSIISNNCENKCLSKNCLRKIRHHAKVLESKKNKRKFEKMRRKKRLAELKLTSQGHQVRENPKIVRERLKMARNTAPRICVDLSFAYLMSVKEMNRLASQLRRLYGSNRKCLKPLHVYFTSFNPSEQLYKICCQKNDGFAHYIIEMSEMNHLELFSREDLVYLTPDSNIILEKFDEKKVYIIGGLVDETIHKKVTLLKANEDGVATACLPIPEVLQKDNKRSLSTVLTVNQVFDILLVMHETGDWTKALCAGVPARKGFTVKS